MRFVKRLVIMSGTGSKGTLSFEKNALGATVRLNSFGAALSKCGLAMEIDGKKYFYNVDSAVQTFALKDLESLDSIKAAVFSGLSLIMCGANGMRLTDGEIAVLRDLNNRKQKKEVAVFEGDNQIFSPRKSFLPPPPPAEASLVEEMPATNEPIAAQEVLAESIIEKAEELPPEITENKKQEPPETMEQYQDELIAESNYFPQEPENIKEEKTVYECLPAKIACAYLLKQAAILKDNLPHKAPEPKPEIIEARAEPKPEIIGSKPQASQEIMPEIMPEIIRKNPKKALDEQKSRQNTEQKPQDEAAQRVAAIKDDAFVPARESTFFEREQDEIEKLFEINPREKELEKILPGSKWVKIDYGSGGKYYVIGLLGKEYLCYGLPAAWTAIPPDELSGYCWWLPLKASEPQGKGYWVMYQNLTTGESVFPIN